MIDFMKDWVLNIVTLVLFIVLIEILVPSGKMKKYIDLVTGIILIIAIINPFLKVVSGKVNINDIQLSNSNYMEKVEIEKNSKVLKEEQMKQIVELYRQKLIRQLEDTAKKTEGVVDASADVIINEDYNSDSFGEIKRAYLEIATGGEKLVAASAVNIEKVEVGKKSNVLTQGEDISPVLKEKLEDKIAGLFSLSKENIVISHQSR